MASKEDAFVMEYLRSMDLQAAAGVIGAEPRPALLEKYREKVEAGRDILGRQVTYEDVVRRLVRLGFASGRECAALLDGTWETEGLDLSLVTEVKKNSSGTVEFKLIDRIGVLKLLLELLKADEDGAEAFLRSLQDGNEEA